MCGWSRGRRAAVEGQDARLPLEQRPPLAAGVGNRDYKGSSINIVDFAPGEEKLKKSDSRWKAIILLWSCRDVAVCHRKVLPSGWRTDGATRRFTWNRRPTRRVRSGWLSRVCMLAIPGERTWLTATATLCLPESGFPRSTAISSRQVGCRTQ